jgi:hypothetical protein
VTRLPFLAFAALVVATVAAFFITQHLKVSTPLLAGFPRPVPAAINPVRGISCFDPAVGKTLNYREMSISFYLLNQSDAVDVWVVDRHLRIVATLASGTFMPGGNHPVRKQFVWDGHENNGPLAPDGQYYVRVRLRHQVRTVTISDSSGPIPFRIITTPPKPRIILVTPRVIRTAQPAQVRIEYAGNEDRAATILIYHLDRRRRATLVKSFLTAGRGHTALWNGMIRKQPAAPGTYVIGLEVTDAACNTARYPAMVSPPPRGAVEVTVLS